MGKNHGQYNVSGVLFSDVFKRLVDSKIIKKHRQI